ncbi:MAG: hypothetical protein NTY19_04790 [Planctomycetota bacterium]|nr:hypothetical protein [Planctomycetota bacterium]
MIATLTTLADDNAAYQSSPIKRPRRTKSQMETLRDGLFALAEEHQPLTIRQLFYRAVVTSLIDKTQNAYNNVVVRLLGQMREDGRVPFEWIVDNTRWMRKPRTYSGLRQMLEYTKKTYRRAIWDVQKVYVEIWCESDSVAGILYPITEEYDVPLMPCSGQPSKSFLHSASECIAEENRPCFVYYFGDYDRAGIQISDRINRDLVRYLPDGADFHFERVAINEDQIRKYNLPTRPPKDKRDGWTETVELEAMTTAALQGICDDCITRHIDHEALARLETVEAAERETVGMFLDQLDANA